VQTALLPGEANHGADLSELEIGPGCGTRRTLPRGKTLLQLTLEWGTVSLG